MYAKLLSQRSYKKLCWEIIFEILEFDRNLFLHLHISAISLCHCRFIRKWMGIVPKLEKGSCQKLVFNLKHVKDDVILRFLIETFLRKDWQKYRTLKRKTCVRSNKEMSTTDLAC